jgi:multidrug efflux pump subunit AcrA (membrane-fusion protein)
MQFRRQALRQLEAPEQLDQVVRLTTVPSWLLTGALAAVVAIAAAWATAGTVDRTVRAAGVLIHSNGVSRFDAAEGGQVVKIWARPNQLVGPSTPLYTVRAEDGLHTVSAPWDAYVLGLLISEGQLLQPSTPVAELERLNAAGDPLQAVVFVPASSAPALRAGVTAQVAAAAVPSTVFGTLHGEVVAVGAFPETESSMHAFLGSGFEVAPLLRGGSVVRVVVALAVDPDSPSGLEWSKSPPPFALNSESQVTATFVVAREHPIAWLVGR